MSKTVIIFLFYPNFISIGSTYLYAEKDLAEAPDIINYSILGYMLRATCISLQAISNL